MIRRNSYSKRIVKDSPTLVYRLTPGERFGRIPRKRIEDRRDAAAGVETEAPRSIEQAGALHSPHNSIFVYAPTTSTKTEKGICNVRTEVDRGRLASAVKHVGYARGVKRCDQ